MNNFDKVGEFITLFQASHEPSLWFKLITEEFNELKAAWEDNDKVEMADALADLEYVIHGMAHSLGIPSQKVFDEVHRSNMTKMGADGLPVYREDGKLMKGPNYEPPNLKPILGIT